MRFSKRRVCAIVASGLLLPLTGCLTPPKVTRRATPAAPPSFSGQSTTEASESPKELATWWTSFHDEELNSLITRAIAGNLDVQVAVGRLREARATLRYTASSQQLPAVNLDNSFNKVATSQENPQIPKFNASSAGFGGSTLIPSQYGIYQAYFDASYELDLFGTVRHAVRASAADAQAYEDNLRDRLVSTVAEVARDYVLYRQYQQQIAVAKRNLVAQRDTLRITQIRYQAGLAIASDVAQAAGNVAGTEATLPSLQVYRDQTAHALAVLLGDQPEALTKELAAEQEVPRSAADLAVGLPTTLLRRRPDVRAAERNLAAADERVASQVATLFPTITFSAQYGTQTGRFGNLADSAALYFSYGPKLSWGILNYATTKQNIRTYQARAGQQYATYEKTVLTAFQDVDDAMVAFHSEAIRQQALQEQVSEARKSLAVSQERYTRGLSNFLNVLDAQRSVLNAENTLVQSRATVSTDLIALYKAVGGGWEMNDLAAVSPAKP